MEGILSADNQAIKLINDLVLPSVVQWVKENNGSESDARDIHQEAIIALFRKMEDGNFTLTCTLKSFLRIMCRNLWLTRIRNNKKFVGTELEDVEQVSLEKNMIIRLEQSKKQQLFFKHLDALGENCKKIMQWFFDKMPLKKLPKN